MMILRPLMTLAFTLAALPLAAQELTLPAQPPEAASPFAFAQSGKKAERAMERKRPIVQAV